jgi:hypothetical protein
MDGAWDQFRQGVRSFDEIRGGVHQLALGRARDRDRTPAAIAREQKIGSARRLLPFPWAT